MAVRPLGQRALPRQEHFWLYLRVSVKTWGPIQLGIFWLALAIFGLPVWLVLSLIGSMLTDRFQWQAWFELIPILLAFLVVFSVVGLGLVVTLRWLDGRRARSAD